MASGDKKSRIGWLVEAVFTVLVKAGLELLLGSGVLATFAIAYVYLVGHQTQVFETATGVLLALLLLTLLYTVVTRRRLADQTYRLLTCSEVAKGVEDLERLLKRLRAVDLYIRIASSNYQQNGNTTVEEAQRLLVQAVLRPLSGLLERDGREPVRLGFHRWDTNAGHFHSVWSVPELTVKESKDVEEFGWDSMLGRVLQQAKPLIIVDVDSEDARQRGWATSAAFSEVRSMLLVPTCHLDQVPLGVITAASEKSGAYVEADKRLVMEFAAKIALVYDAGIISCFGSGHRDASPLS